MDGSGLRRLFDLRRGEGRTVGLAVATAFVVSAGLMVGQSGIEALFFVRHGVTALPVMYIILGVLMFIATLGIGSLVDRVGRRRACLAIPTAVALLAVAGRLGLAADIEWITRGLWLLQGAGQFLLGLAVWGIAGLVADTRQAKRFFPLIGGGGVLGYVIGGIVTKPLASWLGAPNLLLVWALTLAGTVFLGVRVLSDVPSRPRELRERSSGGMLVGMRTVWRSELLRWFALGAALLSLLFFSLYLPFSRAATERYPDASELAGFFGVFFGVATGVALVVSLFVSGRLLSRFGAPAVLLVLPLLYLVGFAVLTVDATFVALAVVRFAQVAWMQGSATSAWEAVINVVPPDRRDQTRAFLYGGPTQVGTFLAGAIALVGERTLSPDALYAIGFASAAVAVFAMVGVRRSYPRELLRALREGRPEVFGSPVVGSAGPIGIAPADANAREVALRGLADPDVRVRRVAATVLGELDRPGSEAPLVAALQDPDEGVRAAAVSSLSTGTSGSVRAAIEGLAADPAPAVRVAAVDAIAGWVHSSPASTPVLETMLLDEDPTVRSRAAAVLAGLGPAPSAVATLAQLAGSSSVDVRATAYRAMRGVDAASLRDVAREGVADPAPLVRAEAARALVSIDPPAAADLLIPMTADPSRSVREAVGEALGSIGESVVDDVVACLDDATRVDGALTALANLPTVRRHAQIRSFASSAVVRAVDLHRLGAGIAAETDDRLRLLRDSVRARSEQDAVSALRATALLGARAEIGVAVDNLADGDPLQRANALEVIDSVAERRLVRPLLQMWEHTPSAPDDGDPLVRLRSDPDEWIRTCVEFSMAPRGGSMETLTSLSPMERVLFLRKVPLFAHLPPPDLLSIASIAREGSFDPGETIATQGEIGDEMHIIVSGEVEVMVPDAGGRRVLATRSSGDVVGEMAVITDEPRIASLLARDQVRVLTLDRRGFASILRERPETALGVIRVLCDRLAEAGGPVQDGAGGPTGTTTAST